MRQVSFFRAGHLSKPDKTVSITSVYDAIRGDQFKENTLRIQDLHRDGIQDGFVNLPKKPYQEDKKTLLHAVCFSGIIDRSQQEGNIHNGLICLDIDGNGAKAQTRLMQAIKEGKLPACEAAGLSISGIYTSDFWANFSIEVPEGVDPNEVNHAYHAYLEKYIQNEFDVKIGSAKDFKRVRYLCHDPELYVNTSCATISWEECQKSLQEQRAAEAAKKTAVKKIEAKGKKIRPRDRKLWIQQITKAVEQIEEHGIDLLQDYNEAQTVLFSVAVLGEDGRDLYYRICAQSKKESRQAEMSWKYDEALQNGRFTSPAKLFTVCRGLGIDTSAEVDVQTLMDDESRFTLPDGCNWEEVKEDIMKYGFIEHHNCYFMMKGVGEGEDRRYIFNQVSNFILRPLYHIHSVDDPRRVMEAVNFRNDSRVIDNSTDTFVSLNDFNKATQRLGNFFFEGNVNDLNRIKKKLYDIDRTAFEVRTMGWHKDGFWVWANGIYNGAFTPIDEYGVVEIHRKSYFIPPLSEIYSEDDSKYSGEKKFTYKPGDVKGADWMRTFCDVHKDNGRIGLAYYITSLFRDLIYKELKFFPHLFLFGPPGTGKSQLGWSLTGMFGESQGPYNLNAGTKPSFFRKFAQFRNAIVWFDEYANSIDIYRVQNLKGAYDGVGHEKAEMNNSNRTISTTVESACIISGQEMPVADVALFKRVILCEFYQTEYSQQEKDALKALQNMEKEGLSHITARLLKERDMVRECWAQVYTSVAKKMANDLKGYEVETRILNNMAVIVAVASIFKGHEVIGAHLPYTYEELYDTAIKSITRQSSLIANGNETRSFWDIVEYMYASGMIMKDVDFKFTLETNVSVEDGRTVKMIQFDNAKNVMSIDMAKIHPLYMEMFRKQNGKTGMDKNTLVRYLQNSKGYIGIQKSTRIGGKVKRAFCFSAEALGVNLGQYDEQPLSPPHTL